ncbi:similar to Saccharomyces cerevisiae YOR155C ISN1 Inosine 5'-monophosphate (IMP)- specific 5'-nucleotidase [Maudiozyma barnettii]|uniref:IMP-specific 5'-nucleotidase 1 n=1 Tax=Maudiozyma barnettii TaxID=61262 RepID=A0A8H2ZG19_9SACH|nr:similar to Saccharomyces cerevisiae YOR155C ISN1 Inosine 5'-monophosphate (IMP)- specific 5'-nucleotidase [Kazachstania barnettii]CAB4252335.1 similar to Saccharomyces cerevisiae YOR155C ISN1 Inosine 5'-monophosphate (IMP)- specific 5'-nucleotidase [Kazachstania barnettii]CAD1779069.1 similar to Saccharomyces cerevisiae YOR155C ISN1 Inosine 5'-monophosphate (IMP)- specific 5'-nucleotidase [Kazachstania barnettii]
MSSRYRVEYHLKSHRKDEFIEWIKGLLATPFVLHAVSPVEEGDDLTTTQRVKSKYADILKDIEQLIINKIEFDEHNISISGAYLNGSSPDAKSRLNMLVPSIGTFFTELPLERAFLWEDSQRAISSRRMIAPSFNDIRHILNTAQILHFVKQKRMGYKGGRPLKLVTFDGDVTLYEDGGSLNDSNPVVPHIMQLLANNIKVGIVTAAGYDEAASYESRLEGLMSQLHASTTLTSEQKSNLTVMGGECNYLFRYCDDIKRDDDGKTYGLEYFHRETWALEEIKNWTKQEMDTLLDYAEKTLNTLKIRLNLPSEIPIIRKKRAVGIIPGKRFDVSLQRNVPLKLSREQLEEIVLTLQNSISNSPTSSNIKFSCFDGGSDVWCDIGDKNLGIRCLQHFYDPENPIQPYETLHIGDQFAPMGSANDFKARLAGCTLWIASPAETVDILNRLLE